MQTKFNKNRNLKLKRPWISLNETLLALLKIMILNHRKKFNAFFWDKFQHFSSPHFVKMILTIYIYFSHIFIQSVGLTSSTNHSLYITIRCGKWVQSWIFEYPGNYNWPELQIRAGQQSITINLWPLTAQIYHVMIIVTGGFSKRSFYYYYYFFLEIPLNDPELVFLELLNIRTAFYSMVKSRCLSSTDFFLMREHFYFIWQLQGIDIRLCYLL